MELSRTAKEAIVKARAEKARRHLIDYCQFIDRNYVAPKHLRLLCDYLEKVERGELKRLMVFMPPRHGKSETVSRKFPAWYLGRNPKKYVIHSSYAESLSQSFSRVVRNQIESRKYRAVFNVATASDSRGVSDWNTSQGGGFLSSGVGGSITGRGAHLYLIDDPVKNQEEAESKTMREKVWEWYKSTAFTRLEPGAAMVVIQTRWHQQDLSGKLLEQQRERDSRKDVEIEDDEDWTVINIPAVAETPNKEANILPDALGRKPGEALWKERYNEKKLEEIKFTVGSRIWYALYQGRPQDPETQIFKREWIRWYKECPPEEARGGGIDTATSKKDKADNMALVDAARDAEGFIYIDDVFCEKVSVSPFARHVSNQHNLKNYTLIQLESNNAGEAIRQRIEEVGMEDGTYPPVKPKVTSTDKVVRAMEWQHLVETGIVRFKSGHRKVAELVEHMVNFDGLGGDVDDDVDACGFAISAVKEGDGFALGGDDFNHKRE